MTGPVNQSRHSQLPKQTRAPFGIQHTWDTMKKTTPAPIPEPIHAAQYVRMSDDGQQYSIENQEAAIKEFADQHGFVVVRTYADEGKSGIVLKHRTGLRQLIQDVIGGNTDYTVILVYDVSRWGRFLNIDEGAHYEFLCTSAGVRVCYCAEQFQNDNSPTSAILKALKRSMAAEFSRELSIKVFRGKCRIAGYGFWMGGPPGYGYRRLMVSVAGKPKQKLKLGEHKSLTTDRIILVPGPRKEVENVRRMFALAVQKRIGCTAIARELNRDGTLNRGRPWKHQDVFNVLTNPKYTGCNVWNRSSSRLHTPRIRLAKEQWVTKAGAFEPLVDQATFDQVQIRLPRHADDVWSDQELLRKLKKVLAAKGRISEGLILRARGMPSTNTLHKRFGSYLQMYKLVGYQPPAKNIITSERGRRTRQLHLELVHQIVDLFPKQVTVTHLPNRNRSVLRVDNEFLVSVLLCRSTHRKEGKLHWLVVPCPAERDNITLLCKLNPTHDGILSFYVFPRINIRVHRSFEDDPWLANATELKSLLEFHDIVRAFRDAA